MLKVSENPPVRPPRSESVAELPGRWWVAHTKSRFEKAFAWDMLHREIGYFLPTVERVRVSGGRKRRVWVPLFSSYVFFCGSQEDRLAAMMTNRLCQTLEVVDQGVLVSELVAIEKALAAKVELDPYSFAAVGRRCRIKSGPCEGLEGTVIQRHKQARLVLQVSILGQGASMEVDADLLESVQ